MVTGKNASVLIWIQTKNDRENLYWFPLVIGKNARVLIWIQRLRIREKICIDFHCITFDTETFLYRQRVQECKSLTNFGSKPGKDVSDKIRIRDRFSNGHQLIGKAAHFFKEFITRLADSSSCLYQPVKLHVSIRLEWYFGYFYVAL